MSDEITNQMIDDILCAAFEGGINYWCGNVMVLGDWPEGAKYASECPSRGGQLALPEQDDYETTWHPLDRGRIEAGIRKAAIESNQSVEEFYENHDAGDADCAVQYALFGEVVYG